MLPEQNRALERLCEELKIPNINELKRVLIDNSDVKMADTQWPSSEEEFYQEIKQYIYKERGLI